MLSSIGDAFKRNQAFSRLWLLWSCSNTFFVVSILNVFYSISFSISFNYYIKRSIWTDKTWGKFCKLYLSSSVLNTNVNLGIISSNLRLLCLYTHSISFKRQNRICRINSQLFFFIKELIRKWFSFIINRIHIKNQMQNQRYKDYKQSMKYSRSRWGKNSKKKYFTNIQILIKFMSNEPYRFNF